MLKNLMSLRVGTTQQSLPIAIGSFAAHASDSRVSNKDYSKKTFFRSPPDSYRDSFQLKNAFYLLLLTLISCTNNPNYQGKGEAYLQGEWQQDSVPAQKQLLTYSLYNLKFDCDSFFFKVSTFSKVNYGNDTCMNRGHWTEYMKGGYQLRHDTVFMDGGFCNPDYTLKADGGCFRTGSYREFFVLTKKTDSQLRLASSTSVIPINVRLIKKTTCIPKPL